jgi:hypothetical protein
MGICHPLFSNAFKCLGNTAVPLQAGLGQDGACAFQISGVVSSADCLVAPAHFCMSTQTTGGPCITSIKKTAHIPAMLPFAVGGCTFKDMDAAVVNVFNPRGAPEEHIDRRDPILRKGIWEYKVSSICNILI